MSDIIPAEQVTEGVALQATVQYLDVNGNQLTAAQLVAAGITITSSDPTNAPAAFANGFADADVTISTAEEVTITVAGNGPNGPVKTVAALTDIVTPPPLALASIVVGPFVPVTP